jgi:hypothetical protein
VGKESNVGVHLICFSCFAPPYVCFFVTDYREDSVPGQGEPSIGDKQFPHKTGCCQQADPVSTGSIASPTKPITSRHKI